MRKKKGLFLERERKEKSLCFCRPHHRRDRESEKILFRFCSSLFEASVPFGSARESVLSQKKTPPEYP